MHARDIMTPDVITAAPDETLAVIAQRMVDHGISAIPIVDSERHVLGIVSEGDLLRRAEIGSTVKRSRWAQLFTTTEQLARKFVAANAQFARDIMSKSVISVAEDTTLDRIVDLLQKHNIKRVPVLREGKLAGIISRADLVRAFARQKLDEPATAASSDAEISRRFYDRLESEPWANSAWINFTVRDGVIDLWGLVSSEDRRRALRVLAESTPGVVGVETHFLSSTTMPATG